MRLNKNNFLFWDGAFTEAPYSVTATNDAASATTLVTSVDIPILANDVATYGIDLTSVFITSSSNTINPPVWNPVTQLLTYYIDTGVAVPNTQTVKYKFKDLQGNLSNEGTVTIAVTARPTGWRGADYSCLTDNSGRGQYTNLVKIYTDSTGGDVVPAVTKANTSGTDGYIAPDTNIADCPTSDMTQNFIIDNLFRNTVTVTKLTFVKTHPGIGPTEQWVYNVNVLPFTQKTIKIPNIVFTSVRINGTSITPAGQCYMTYGSPANTIGAIPYASGTANFAPPSGYDATSGANLRIAVGYDIY